MSHGTFRAAPGLRLNAGWTLGAHIVYALAQWGLLIALARLADPGALGRFTLALAITAPVLMLANLQLRGLLASDSNQDVRPGVYVSLRLATTLLAATVLVGIAVLGPYNRQAGAVLVVLAVAKSVEAVSDVLHGYLHRHEQLGVVARSIMVRATTGLLGFVLALSSTGDLVAAAGALAVAAVVVLVAYDVPAVLSLARRVREPATVLAPVWSIRDMYHLAWTALPLGVVMMLLSLITAVPRFVVEAHWGEAVLGAFSALAYTMALLTPIASAIGQAALPRLARAHAAPDVRPYASLVARLVLVGLALGAAGVLVAAVAGRQLLTLFYGADYAQHTAAFVLIMVAAGMSSVASLGGFILTAARHLRSQAVLLLASLAAVLATSAALVPRSGVTGGAWALVSGSTVQMVGVLGLVVMSIAHHKPASDPPGEPAHPSERPLRALHVIGSLERGGAENWLRQVTQSTDPDQMVVHVALHRPGDGAYGATMRAHGARLWDCPLHGGIWAYQHRLRSILRAEGPFDVVHSHVHHFSGVVLAIAALEGVPVRIAHAHTDSSLVDGNAGLVRTAYLRAMRLLLQRAATGVQAASDVAGQSLTGGRWTENAHNHIMRCSIDLEPFRIPVSTEVRVRDLHIHEDALVLGHVGRFDDAKNQTFLLDVAAAAAKLDPRVHLLLVGDGPLRERVEARSRALGLASRVTFTGDRNDVPTLMGAMDVLVFPSRFEGLPLVAIEAQASGLPLVVSDAVTREIAIVPGMTTFTSLQQTATEWAVAALDAPTADRDETRAHALETLTGSPFDISTGAAHLVGVYRSGLRAHRAQAREVRTGVERDGR